MRSAAALGLVALLAVGCTSAGSELLVETAGPADQTEPGENAEPAETETPDLCSVWAEGNEISEIHGRAGWSSDLDEEILTAWISPLYISAIDDLLVVLPEGYEMLAVFFTAQNELLSEDSTATPDDLEERILEETGLDIDELTQLADDLFDEIESTCGPVVELEEVEIEDPGEVPDHVRRVARELRIERLVECLTAPTSIELVDSLLDRWADREPLVELARDCGATEPEAQLFAWRVTDIEWYCCGPEITGDVVLLPEASPILPGDAERYDEILERLGEPTELAVPELVPEMLEPLPEPTTEAYGYPIEGLVADVLGTLGIVGDEAACLVEGGVYGPASLWLNEPGLDPDVVAEQRALLDDVAAACGFGTDHVDEWLRLAHQYVAEVAAYG